MRQAERWYRCYEGTRKDLFTAESNRHPAKMAVGLCFRIFEHGERMGYWKKGDLILDPMAGIGTTLIVGAVLSYRTVGIELEGHFVDLAWANVAYLAKKQLEAAPRISIVQGDARWLTEIVRIGGAVCSPPYANVMSSDSPGGIDWTKQKDGRTVPSTHSQGNMPNSYSGVVSSPPFLDSDPRAHPGFQLLPGMKAGPNSVITSPPYGEMQVMEGDQAAHPGFKNCHLDERTDRGKIRETPGAIGYSGAVTSPPYAESEITSQGHFFSAREAHQNPAKDNPHEGYSGVVSSPPYGDITLSDGSGITWKVRQIIREQGMDKAVEFYRREVMDKLPKHGRWTDENIRKHLELAVAIEEGSYSGVVSSPPYGNTDRQGKRDIKTRIERLNQLGLDGKSWFGKARCSDLRIEAPGTEGQIGNLRDPVGDIDAVLSSPPYRDTMSTGEARGRPSSGWVEAKGIPHNKYGGAEGQIGNIPNDETYLSAMCQVYGELWRVLKPGGVCCLVTKNPVRAGKIRRLDEDTIRLMEHCGFRLIERHYAMLTEDLGEQATIFGQPERIQREHKSFFKRLFERKYPDLRVDHEDVLWFCK